MILPILKLTIGLNKVVQQQEYKILRYQFLVIHFGQRFSKRETVSLFFVIRKRNLNTLYTHYDNGNFWDIINYSF